MVPASDVPVGKGASNFATFLFAAKDWQLGDFATAVTLFEQFTKSESLGAFGWINEYKPLAENTSLNIGVTRSGKDTRPISILSRKSMLAEWARCGHRTGEAVEPARRGASR